MRRAKAALFAVNPWPPIADGLTIALAVMVVLVMAAAIAHGGLSSRLASADGALAAEKDARARIEARLRAIAPGGAVAFEDGKVILQGEVLFASGSDVLSGTGEETIHQLAPGLAQLLAAEPDQMVLVGGHTDDVPIATDRFASNWALSAGRATAAAHAFVDAGVDPARIIASGFGAHHPRGDNHTVEGRRANRRIEILLVPARAVSSR